MNNTTSLLAAVAFSTLLLPAFAQAQATGPQTPNLDRREANQQRRIDEGVKSGQLTPRETAMLERREGSLNANEAKAKADGVVTPKERAQLQREANRDSRAIAREKHDRQHVKK
ncbi:MAG: hypothetical protein EXR27_06595 [Betaproteobacteria bacterium]|nr:hypothetical protein [Betaproteobacteria bacterium]